MQITGDLPGSMSAYVEDSLGNGAVALWTSGAAGDQNPLFQTSYNQDAPDVHDEGVGGWAILDVLSRRLGEEIVRVTRRIDNTSDKVTLWGQSTSVTCPGRQRAVPLAPGEPLRPLLSLRALLPLLALALPPLLALFALLLLLHLLQLLSPLSCFS